MRASLLEERSKKINNLQLVIGLFCGWAFDPIKLKEVIISKTGLQEKAIKGMDIPPSKYHCLEVYTKNETISLSLDDVKQAVRPSCQLCGDMTAEFSDISVGAARLPEGWNEARNWNQVIVRTGKGAELMKLAKRRIVLEFHDLPEKNLINLKKAAMSKKRSATDA
jgi:coenzyme F420 hydrogenase subunit beta